MALGLQPNLNSLRCVIYNPKVFSAQSLRPLRLCGELICTNI